MINESEHDFGWCPNCDSKNIISQPSSHHMGEIIIEQDCEDCNSNWGATFVFRQHHDIQTYGEEE